MRFALFDILDILCVLSLKNTKEILLSEREMSFWIIFPQKSVVGIYCIIKKHSLEMLSINTFRHSKEKNKRYKKKVVCDQYIMFLLFSKELKAY